MAHTPLRTCAGTQQKLPQAQLLRIVNVQGTPTPEVLLGPHRAQGRGVYVCPNETAYRAAHKRKAFANRLKTNKPPVPWAEIQAHLSSTPHSNHE